VSISTNRSLRAMLSSLLMVSFVGFGARLQAADKAEVTVELAGPTHHVNRLIFGQFLEHFGRIIQGGLWAELLQNRKFYPIDPDRTQVADPWKPETDRSHVSYVIDRFQSLDGISSQRVSLFGEASQWRGISQSGFDVVAGREYVAYAWIKTDTPGHRAEFRLESSDGKKQSKIDVAIRAADWTRYEVRLRSTADLHPATFRILFDGSGTYWIGAASLMPADNVEGIRRDVLELVRRMSPTIIRWPGGGYPDDYDWRRAIGPRDRRPPQPILPFGWPLGYDHGIDSSDFGTDEFLAFCNLIGAKPYITANFGSGTPEMAASWVEYVNGKATSTYGKIRASNGHPEPYGVKYWSIGNEVWGDPFESGHTNAFGYSYFMPEIARAMRAVDPSISITAVGLLGNDNVSDPDWNQVVLQKAGRSFNLLSIHHYYPTGYRPAVFDGKPRDFDLSVLADPWIFEKHLHELVNEIDQITGTPGRIKIALDEWSEWDWDYRPPADTSKRSFVNQFIDLLDQTGLELNHNARDALFDARMLQTIIRMSDSIPIAVRTHMINSLGAIRTDSTRSFLTASGVVMELYGNHSGDTVVPFVQDSPTFDVPELGWKNVPYLDAVVTRSKTELFVHLINVHPTQGLDVHIVIHGGTLSHQGILWRIVPASLNSMNTFAQSGVQLERVPTDSLSSDMVIQLPPHSIVTIEVDVNAARGP